jgi:hypothetical protein
MLAVLVVRARGHVGYECCNGGGYGGHVGLGMWCCNGGGHVGYEVCTLNFMQCWWL